MKLENLQAKDLHAISVLLRSAYNQASVLQDGWIGPLAEVERLADEYCNAAAYAETRESAGE